MKLFESKIKLTDKAKSGKNVRSPELVEVVWVQYDLVDNQYQKKCEVLYLFTPNIFWTYLLNVEPCRLVILKTDNTEFGAIIIKSTYQMADL